MTNNSKVPKTYPYSHRLDNVPENIQVELEVVKSLILQEFDTKVAMIWLFGSYARGDAINDRRVDPQTGVVSEYHSDLDIFVVVYGRTTAQKHQRWAELRHHIHTHPDIKTPVHLL